MGQHVVGHPTFIKKTLIRKKEREKWKEDKGNIG
jgi:hypothetical protein